MLTPNLKNYLLLHSVVFVWGFTAVLGVLISIDAIPLVGIRMAMATLFLFSYIWLTKKELLRVNKALFFKYVGVGGVLTVHWIFFFLSIKTSNVSVGLLMLSCASFFAAILEPFWFKRKVRAYEVLLGAVVIIGLAVSLGFETHYLKGTILGLMSALTATLFNLSNAKLVKVHSPVQISFYEILAGTLFLFMFMPIQYGFSLSHFELRASDWIYLAILASFCTSWAFSASIKVMKSLSPYTVMLTTSLEPVYGIILAFLIFGEKEHMGLQFYIGGGITMVGVVANGFLKMRQSKSAKKKVLKN